MPSRFTQHVCESQGGFDFVGAHFACEGDRFSSDNPRGFVNLGSAQNDLSKDLIESLLAGVSPDMADARYQPFAGSRACREAVAGYLGSQSPGTPIDPDHVVVGNGMIHLLEALAVALLDPGDAVLMPTPVFPGLVAAMSLRVESRVELLHLTAEEGFRLTPERLDAGLEEASRANKQVKAVLLCSPGNPVGQVFTASEIDAFVGISERHDCSLIVDEVYASSCFERDAFTSAVGHTSEHVFVLGGLSKDFGLAGYATGWIHSRHAEVNLALAKQAHFYRLPTPVQRLMQRVLEPSWREAFLDENRRRLGEAAAITREGLEAIGVPVFATESGLCLWLDMRGWLAEPNATSEHELYRTLLEEHRVHVSPGAGFYCPEPGFFRICFSQTEATLREGVTRLRGALTASARPSPLPLPTDARRECPTA